MGTLYVTEHFFSIIYISYNMLQRTTADNENTMSHVYTFI